MNGVDRSQGVGRLVRGATTVMTSRSVNGWPKCEARSDTFTKLPQVKSAGHRGVLLAFILVKNSCRHHILTRWNGTNYLRGLPNAPLSELITVLLLVLRVEEVHAAPNLCGST
jgi:hypothetical protein